MARFEPDSEKGKKMNWRQMSVESRDDDAVTLLQIIRCDFKDAFEDYFEKMLLLIWVLINSKLVQIRQQCQSSQDCGGAETARPDRGVLARRPALRLQGNPLHRAGRERKSCQFICR